MIDARLYNQNINRLSFLLNDKRTQLFKIGGICDDSSFSNGDETASPILRSDGILEMAISRLIGSTFRS